MYARLLLAALLASLPAAVACTAQAGIHDLRATPVRRGESTLSPKFGGDVLGQPIWLSENGRIALVYRLDADTDGNGRIEARFGHHGEALADEPRLWAYDLESGTEARYGELLVIDPTGRYAALRRDGRYVLLDAATGQERDLSAWGISGADDQNPCLPPRQLQFDGEGRRLAFLRGEPARLVVREMESGAETEVQADSGVLWRGGFGPWPGWVRLDVVQPGDSAAFPRLRTSCVSRAATAFAQSYSFQGWQGPGFRSRLVGPGGTRISAPGLAVMVGTRAYAVGDSALFRVGGERIALPDGCGEMMVMEGAPAVVLRCGDGASLLDPATGRVTRLPAGVWAAKNLRGAVRDAQGRWWAPVLLDIGPDSHTRHRPPEYRLSRLRMDDGRIEAGPRVQTFYRGEAGWVTSAGETEVYALNVATGALLALPTGRRKHAYGSGLVQDPDKEEDREILAMDRAASFAVPLTAGASTRSGCVLEARHAENGMQRGPWRRRCLAPTPAP